MYLVSMTWLLGVVSGLFFSLWDSRSFSYSDIISNVSFPFSVAVCARQRRLQIIKIGLTPPRHSNVFYNLCHLILYTYINKYICKFPHEKIIFRSLVEHLLFPPSWKPIYQSPALPISHILTIWNYSFSQKPLRVTVSPHAEPRAYVLHDVFFFFPFLWT